VYEKYIYWREKAKEEEKEKEVERRGPERKKDVMEVEGGARNRNRSLSLTFSSLDRSKKIVNIYINYFNIYHQDQ